MNKKAFTLLELLVVVLIIGILAAIALPQYRKAVAKTELTQLLSTVKTFVNSTRNYYLTNNALPSDINNLDIALEDGDTKCELIGAHTDFRYLLCSNKKFSIWVEMYANGKAFITEIGTNSVENNPSLTYACTELYKNTLSSCYKQTASSTCVRFGLKNIGCFTCRGMKYV